MKIRNNLKIQHSCFNCDLRTDNFFCNFPWSVSQVFESLKITNTYQKGATLFMQGQSSNGIYMLCNGRVKLSIGSKDGKVIVLRIAEAGEVLGLSATVSNYFYEATAEALEPCQVNFMRKEDFLRFLAEKPEAYINVVKQLSQNCRSAYAQIRSFGLSSSVSDKLAKLILEWCEKDGETESDIRLKLLYTHEELAEMIATSRETVTRVLKEFRKRNLITLKGSVLIVHDKAKLEAAIGVRQRA